MKTAIAIALLIGSFAIGIVVSIALTSPTTNSNPDLYVAKEIPLTSYKSY